MEVDYVPYIFGSFARRRHSQKLCGGPKRQNQDGQSVIGQQSGSSRTGDVCALCKKVYLEPRVLACLHTFCTRCLRDRKQEPCLVCPKCHLPTMLDYRGVYGLPPDYIAQHRIVLATLNHENTRLLCDLCTSDVTASHRCSKCLISLCELCTEMHRRYAHELLAIKDVREKGVMKIRRQIMCQQHPEMELCAYCTQCAQVICRSCVQTGHGNHARESAVCAFHARVPRMRQAVDKARSVLDGQAHLGQLLDEAPAVLEDRYRQLEADIEAFIDTYRNAIETHRLKLLQQVADVREEKYAALKREREQLEERMTQIQSTIQFTDELLNEGSDIEMLTFLNMVLKKFEQFATATITEPFAAGVEPDLNFLPHVPCDSDSPVILYGLLADTSHVNPKQCLFLNTDGLENVRLNEKVELILEMRDDTGKRIRHGGQTICAQLISCAEETPRSVKVRTEDKQDGTYLISFIPNAVGTFSLIIQVQKQLIEGSPWRVIVQPPFSAVELRTRSTSQ